MVLAEPGGAWELSEIPGASQIVAVERAVGRPMPKVRARVTGKGPNRRLTWSATRANRHQLQFSEVMPDGTTHPILRTNRASGSKRFQPLGEGHYGRRKLEVGFHQRYSQRATRVADRYTVRKPMRLRGPARIRAIRLGDTIRVRWSEVKRASGYEVEVRGPDGSFGMQQELPRRARHAIFRGTPGAAGTTVRIRAYNRDSIAGRPRSARVAHSGASPSLRASVRRALRGANPSKRGVAVTLPCPSGGECHGRARIMRHGRAMGSVRLRHVPASTASRGLVELPRGLARKLRSGRAKAKLRVSVAQLGERSGGGRRLGR